MSPKLHPCNPCFPKIMKQRESKKCHLQANLKYTWNSSYFSPVLFTCYSLNGTSSKY